MALHCVVCGVQGLADCLAGSRKFNSLNLCDELLVVFFSALAGEWNRKVRLDTEGVKLWSLGLVYVFLVLFCLN